MQLSLRLIAVSETSHTGHNTENVVVHGVDVQSIHVITVECELGGIDTREVASATGLVFLRAESKRVHSDRISNSSGSETGVGFPDLVTGEVLKIAGSETIGTVEDDLGGEGGGGTVSSSSDGRSTAGGGDNDGTGGGTSSNIVDGAGRGEGSGGTDPNKFLNGVVEVKADGVGAGGTAGGFLLGLELIDEVLVGILGELATLGGVEVHVISIDGKVAAGGETRNNGTTIHPAGLLGEGDVKLDVVVLKSDQRHGKTGVAAEPETHGNIHFGGTSGGNGGSTRLVSVGHALVFGGGVGINGTRTSVHTGFSTIGSKFTLGTGGVALGKIAPHAEPHTVLTVDELTSDFDFEGLEKCVGDIASEHTGFVGSHQVGNIELNPKVLEKISVTGDGHRNTGSSSNRAIDSLLDRFNGKVGVAAVNAFEEGNLGLSGEIYVLRSISDELHKTTSHFACCWFSTL